MEILKIKGLTNLCTVQVDDQPEFNEVDIIVGDGYDNQTMTVKNIEGSDMLIISFEIIDTKYKICRDDEKALNEIIEVIKKVSRLNSLINQHLNIIIDFEG